MTTTPPDPTNRERRRRAALPAVALITAGTLVAGLAAGIGCGQTGDERPRATRIVVPARFVPGPPRSRPASGAAPTADRRTGRRPARPVRLEIPGIGVKARVVRLGLNPDRTLQTPKRFGDTGWWSGGARPGERGPAVIVGHVDSKTGPAVFYRLRDLRRGDGIRVVGADGRRVRFTVRRTAHYPKDHFPTKLVYGPTSRPTLRLITCSGSFDRQTGHYLDNTVAFADEAPGR